MIPQGPQISQKDYVMVCLDGFRILNICVKLGQIRWINQI